MSDSVEELTAFAEGALAGFGLHPRTRLRLLNISENGTFAVDDPDQGRSVLRVHRDGYQSAEAIRSELAWIAALREARVVDTPAFLPGVDGAPVVLSTLPDGRARHVVRFAWVDGVEPHAERLASDFEHLGAIAARLHWHARTWRRPPGFTRFTWDCETAIGEAGHWGRWQDGLGVGPAERAVLGRAATVVRHRLAVYGTGPERFGLVHADMRLANLLVDGDRVTVIDFDDCGFSWFMYDLAASVSFIEHEPYIPELIDAWVRGYRSVAPLEAADEAELATLVMLRRLLLVAWIGSHSTTETAQQLGEQYSTDSCDLAETYLSTHI